MGRAALSRSKLRIGRAGGTLAPPRAGRGGARPRAGAMRGAAITLAAPLAKPDGATLAGFCNNGFFSDRGTNIISLPLVATKLRVNGSHNGMPDSTHTLP